MAMKLRQIASIIDAEIPKEYADCEICGVKSLIEAQEGDISFYSNDKYRNDLDNTKASAVILDSKSPDIASYNWIPIAVQDVPLAISKLLSAFSQKSQFKPLIHDSAVIHSSVQHSAQVHIGHHSVIEEDASIGNFVTLMGNNFIGKNVVIGEGTILYPGVVVMDNCKIGKNCVIQSNSVIGSEGFGYVLEGQEFRKVPHIGNVEIENNVEIGANCCIDRASLGTTRIRQGAKLDNLIQIAHNVEIGEHTVMAAQSGVAGSSKIGNYCQIGGQAGIVGHLKIADQTKIQAQSGVTKSISENGTKLYGYPAIDYNNYLRSYVGFKNLPEMLKRLKDLEEKMIQINGRDESKNNKENTDI